MLLARYLTKTLISAIVLVAVSEIAKRKPLFGGLIASLPLTSLLAFIWLYRETHDTDAICNLANGILWMILPSLVLFLLLPALLKRHVPFYAALGLASAGTLAAYALMSFLLKKLGVFQ